MVPTTVDAFSVRASFFKFFESKYKHVFWPSSSVSPHNDPTLLFTNAGMNQFKPIFTGEVDPASNLGKLKRVVNSQKCIRAGGKHNDLDDVGKDNYHHTFFEMLGTWSFGDYFKKEAIAWAMELLVDEWKIPKDRLYATYFGGDESLPHIPQDTESLSTWLKYLPKDRILPFNGKDNFWVMGDTGPCGPCTEIHYDCVGNRDASKLINSGDPDVIEIWNLVFMQFNRQPNGTLSELPISCVDTGMGLERVLAILQGKSSNYDTDLFSPLIEAIHSHVPNTPAYTGSTICTENNYKTDMAYRVVADHIRMLTIAISDGVEPSNEGAGYIVRRVLRRATRYGYQFLGFPKDKPWLYLLADVVSESLDRAFPNIAINLKNIKNLLHQEEEQFMKTLDKGIVLFSKTISKLDKNHKDALFQKSTDNVTSNKECAVFPGKVAFELYTSFGFPLDLVTIMAKENNFIVDIDGFNAAFEEHRLISDNPTFKQTGAQVPGPEHLAQLEKVFSASPTTDSYKYDWSSDEGTGINIDAKIQCIWNGQDLISDLKSVNSKSYLTRTWALVLDKTTFYAEAGGQASDSGTIHLKDTPEDASSDTAIFTVTEVKKFKTFIFHFGRFISEQTAPKFKVGSTVELQVDYQRRKSVAQHHTGTHLLGHLLRSLLGQKADQHGSLCSVERARFDVQAFKPFTDEQLDDIENKIIKSIEAKAPIYMEDVKLQDAKSIPGVFAIFEEAYPDPVRVVSVGNSIKSLLNKDHTGFETSVEFCGGTHLHNTGTLEDFVILSDDSVARSKRRIIFAAGKHAGVVRNSGKEFLERVLKCEAMEDTKEKEDEMVCLKAKLIEYKDKIPLACKKKCTAIVSSYIGELAEKNKNKQKLLKKQAEILGNTLKTMVSENVPYIVLNTPEMTGDLKCMTVAIASLSASPIPIMLVSEAQKQTVVYCVVPPSLKGALDASVWVTNSISDFGGKGGGKSDVARGLCDGRHSESIVRIAKSFAETALATTAV